MRQKGSSFAYAHLQGTSTSLGSGMDVGLGNYVKLTGLGGNLSAKIVAVNINNGGTQRLKVAGVQLVKR